MDLYAETNGMSENEIGEALMKSVNCLYGKTLNLLGDSMGACTQVSNSEDRWPNIIADNNSMTLHNYSVNGLKLGNYSDTGTTLSSKVSGLNTDADYTLVYGGTNDADYNYEIGDIADSYAEGDETFYGNMNDICKELQTLLPGKKIGFILPYKYKTSIVDTTLYLPVMREVLNNHSIPYFDNSVDGNINYSNTTQMTLLTQGDGIHLNEAGMLLMATKIEGFLRSL